jgi:hypothetical protein
VWTTILHMKCEQTALRNPRDINPQIPPPLEEVLLKSVARRPEDRRNQGKNGSRNARADFLASALSGLWRLKFSPSAGRSLVGP